MLADSYVSPNISLVIRQSKHKILMFGVITTLAGTAVFVLFRGEFLVCKINGNNCFDALEHRSKRHPSKQNIKTKLETKTSKQMKSAIGLCTILLIL